MRKYKPNSSQLSLMQPSRRSELEFHFFSNQSCRNIISRNQLFLGSICFKKNNSQKKILTKLFLLGSIYLHEYLTRKHEENFRQSKKRKEIFSGQLNLTIPLREFLPVKQTKPTFPLRFLSNQTDHNPNRSQHFPRSRGEYSQNSPN